MANLSKACSMFFRPKKSLGQNFLQNPRVVQKITAAAALEGNEYVVEVGPGFGILTEALLKSTDRVLAIEKDHFLFKTLKEKFADVKNLTLLHGDALKFKTPETPYLLIANLPYSITSPLLNHFIKDQFMQKKGRPPLRAIVMVQKEVAEKICALPPHMNVLALHLQTFGKPKIVSKVSRYNFQPVPKVDSAIVRIEIASEAKQSAYGIDYKKYFFLIHRAFLHKRKMLRSIFSKELLEKADIDGMRRPETLTIEEWEKIVECSNRNN